MIVPVDQWYRASMPPFPRKPYVGHWLHPAVAWWPGRRRECPIGPQPLRSRRCTAPLSAGRDQSRLLLSIGHDWRRAEQERQGQAEGHESDMCTTGVGAQEKNGISAGSV